MSDKRTPKPPAPFAVPGSRLSRLARLGGLASGVAGGMLAEGLRQLAQGRRPSVGELLLTPANARRVTDQLAQLRGAAMKVGQLLSMDAGDLLPPELADILARFERLRRGDRFLAGGKSFHPDVFFLTGTDEHGLKMAQTAEREGLTPRALADRGGPRTQPG